MNSFFDFFFRFQKAIFGLAIFLSLLAVSIHLDSDGIRLAWQDQPLAALLIISLGLFCFLLYTWTVSYHTRQLSQLIQQQNSASEQLVRKLSLLTDRQKEVYKLIIAGKSNKEIMAERYIEQSTLKTHINQYYKKN